jgi:hypothetical protein
MGILFKFYVLLKNTCLGTTLEFDLFRSVGKEACGTIVEGFLFTVLTSVVIKQHEAYQILLHSSQNCCRVRYTARKFST